MITKLIKTEIMRCNDCPHTKLLYSKDGSIGVRVCTFSSDIKITDTYPDEKNMEFTTCIPEDCKLDSLECCVVGNPIESLYPGDIVEFIGEKDCQYKYLGEKDNIYFFLPLSSCSRYIPFEYPNKPYNVPEGTIGFFSIPEFKVVEFSFKNSSDNG